MESEGTGSKSVAATASAAAAASSPPVPCLLERTLLRVSGGFVKLLFPDKSFSRGELELVVDLALPSLDWMRPYK